MRGFSLLELVIVLMIIGIMAPGIATFMRSGAASYAAAKERNGLTIKTAIAMQRITGELANLMSLQTMLSQQIVFTNHNGDTIEIALSGSTITHKTNAGAAYTLVDDVGGTTPLLFTYFDSNLATTATAANVRVINVSLTVTNGISNIALINSVLARNRLLV